MSRGWVDPPVRGADGPGEATRLEREEERVRAAYASRTGDSQRYAWSDPGHLFLMQSRERRVLGLLRRLGLLPWPEGRKILEVGCGTGTWLRDLVRWGVPPSVLTGIELRGTAIEHARRLTPPTVQIDLASAASLPYPDRSFNVILQSMVFSSVLDQRVRQLIAGEMLRVLAPRGVILWYDFFLDNPRNPDVRGVKRRDVETIFPGCEVEFSRVTLAPPLARAVAPYSTIACQLLELVPVLRTHHLGVIRAVHDR
jgi:SAM-dependent methyltransferase